MSLEAIAKIVITSIPRVFQARSKEAFSATRTTDRWNVVLAAAKTLRSSPSGDSFISLETYTNLLRVIVIVIGG